MAKLSKKRRRRTVAALLFVVSLATIWWRGDNRPASAEMDPYIASAVEVAESVPDDAGTRQ